MFLQDNRIGLFILLLIMLCACTKPRNDTININSSKQQKYWNMSSYKLKVTNNDSIDDIENLTKIPAPILLRYNNIDNITQGMKIKIPERATHLVKSGDSAISIAVKNGMTFSEFIALNNLSAPYKLKIGQNLKLIILNKSTTKNKTKSNIPLIWPVRGKVTSVYGDQKNGYFNDGIKISVVGTQIVLASKNGFVVYSGNEIGNYGNMVIIQHEGGWLTSYGNLSKILVKKGEVVKLRQAIGEINEGELYFSLRNELKAINPQKYLRDR